MPFRRVWLCVLAFLLVLTGVVSVGIDWPGWVAGARPGTPRAAPAT